MITEKDIAFLEEAVELAKEGLRRGMGGPFGCVIVRHGEVIARGYNRVTSANDPTAHAEVVAIREACARLGTYQLEDCILYASCEPCPMCLGAIYWARPAQVWYAATRHMAAEAGFDDKFIYEELPLDNAARSIPFSAYWEDRFLEPFQIWKEWEEKSKY